MEATKQPSMYSKCHASSFRLAQFPTELQTSVCLSTLLLQNAINQLVFPYKVFEAD